MKRFEKYYGWIVAFVFCVAVIAVYKTFDNFHNITYYIGVVIRALKPFLLAFIIAYILNMPAKSLQKLLSRVNNRFIKKHVFGISIIVIYLGACVLVLFILRMLIPALYRNIIDLYNSAPNYISAFQEYIKNFEIVKRFNLDNLDLYAGINKLFDSVDITHLGKYAQGVFDVTSGVFDVFVAIIASIYMLIDKERLQGAIVKIMSLFLKQPTVDAIINNAKRINDIFTNYIYSRLTCSIIMAVICSIVLMLLKVRYALILGLFIGVMDMIPYFGSIISCVISIAVTLITGGLWKGVWTGVVLLVLQQIDGNVLGPKIMGQTLEIRPLWIIFAVSVGGALFGFIGMLISVPVIAIVRAVGSEYIHSREAKIAANTADMQNVPSAKESESHDE